MANNDNTPANRNRRNQRQGGGIPTPGPGERVIINEDGAKRTIEHRGPPRPRGAAQQQGANATGGEQQSAANAGNADANVSAAEQSIGKSGGGSSDWTRLEWLTAAAIGIMALILIAVVLPSGNTATPWGGNEKTDTTQRQPDNEPRERVVRTLGDRENAGRGREQDYASVGNGRQSSRSDAQASAERSHGGKGCRRGDVLKYDESYGRERCFPANGSTQVARTSAKPDCGPGGVLYQDLLKTRPQCWPKSKIEFLTSDRNGGFL